jgi:hypothetical protein
MKFTARLTTESADAESISRALEIDNIRLADLEIKTEHSGGEIVTEIASNNLSTLINTLDDIISCQAAAEKLLKKRE